MMFRLGLQHCVRRLGRIYGNAPNRRVKNFDLLRIEPLLHQGSLPNLPIALRTGL